MAAEKLRSMTIKYRGQKDTKQQIRPDRFPREEIRLSLTAY